MEFGKNVYPCLRQNAQQVQYQEQTQEVRLPDGLPDIGNILAAWGQCILRSKEWRSDGMNVSGGLMAWVLYAPADGSEPRSIETWLPVQMKWSFSDSSREGTIRTAWQLRGIDARMLSARKLMVRATVGVMGEALEPWDAEVCVPEQVPEDVQLLRKSYPAMIPQEAGEKTFSVDEELTLPGGSPAAEKIVYCDLMPVLTEQTVLGGKAVVKGTVRMHLLYRGVDGQLHSVDLDCGFSQFSDLDRDYGKDATLSTIMAVSGLEPELLDGGIRLKCGLVAQYVVCDQVMLELVEDAYSTNRAVTTQMKELYIPMLLDTRHEMMRVEAAVSGQPQQIVDTAVCAEFPMVRRAGDLAELEIPGTFQVLYYDEEGNLQGTTTRWSGMWELPAGDGASVSGSVQSVSRPQTVVSADQMELWAEVQSEALATAQRGIPMVTGLELGEVMAANPSRPSLILRRAGESSLWELAKANGSTMQAIRAANQLSDEPLDDRILLIPVL